MDILDAARNGDVELVRRWLAKGADINARDDDNNYTAVMYAVEAQHFDLADDLRRQGAAFTPADATQILAELCGDDAGPVARYVLAAGADPNAIDSMERPVLISAAWLGSADLVQALLDAGADANATDGQGLTALIAAAANGERASVIALLQAGADPAHTNANHQTAVHAALQRGHAPILRRLLRAGVSPNTTAGGWPPLLLAARRGRPRLVQPLLDAGADPNAAAPDYDTLDHRLAKGTTALMLASEAGQLPMVDMLLAAGANPALEDDRGHTALRRAAANGQTAIVERLRAVCPGVEFDQAAYANVALLRAAGAGDAAHIRRLLESGADPASRSQECETLGQTALHLAAAGGHVSALEALLAGHVDLNAPETVTIFTGTGGSPLHLAAANGHAECVRALLRSGANPNQRDDSGRTPLHAAAEEGHGEAVAALLAGGADRSAVDNSGMLAIAKAAQQGHTEAVRLLYQPGRAAGALACAAANAHEATVRALLDLGESPDAPGTDGDGTALHAATHCYVTWHVPDIQRVTSRRKREYFAARQTAVLRTLLDAGASLETRDAEGRTPLLRLASGEGMLKVASRHMSTTGPSDIVPALELLLDAGADARAVDHGSKTALHYLAIGEPWTASGYKSSAAVRLLLAAGADPDARCAEGWTPLHLNAPRARPGVMRTLVAAGAAVDATDRQGKTPLLMAIEHRQAEAAKFLLAHGADPNRCDAAGLAPLDQALIAGAKRIIHMLRRAGGQERTRLERQLHRAIEQGQDNRVRKLLAQGADPNRRLGWTDAFVQAVSSQRYNVLPLLVAAGGDLNRTAPQDAPWLARACQAGDLELVRVLLALGADPSSVDPRGFSPSLLAAWGRHWDVHQLLVELGVPVDPRAEPFLKIRDFPLRAATATFASAATALESALGAAGQPIEPLPGVVGYTLTADEQAESARLRRGESKMWAGDNALAEHVDQALNRLRSELRQAGFLAVDLGRGIGCGPARRFVGLFPTADPYAVVAAVGTYGNDDERTTPEILAWMRETAEEEPWELRACGRDTLVLAFLDPVKQPLRLADRMMALCSDVGHGGREKLAEQLVATRQASFWWD